MAFVKAHKRRGFRVAAYQRAKRAAARPRPRGTFAPSRRARLAFVRASARKLAPRKVSPGLRHRQARKIGRGRA